MALKKYAAAEGHLRQSLAMARTLPLGTGMRYDRESRLGGALAAQKKFAEAEPLALAGYKGLKSIADKLAQPGGRQLILEALTRIVHLYNAWGKVDEAAKWRWELEEQKKTLTKGQ